MFFRNALKRIFSQGFLSTFFLSFSRLLSRLMLSPPTNVSTEASASAVALDSEISSGNEKKNVAADCYCQEPFSRFDLNRDGQLY